MRKVEFESDQIAIDSYIKELQAQLPQYNITVNNANDFSVMLEEERNCSKCNGLNMCSNANVGYCTHFENEEFSLKECLFKKELRIKNDKNNLIRTLYLPKNILEANLENFNTNSESRKKIYSQIVEFIGNYNSIERKKGLYLHGSFSIGKTYTLACIANELAKYDISCLLIYFPDLVVDLKSALGTSRFDELFNMLKSIDVLMIDDLGSENMSAWLRDDVLGPVINYRVLENKPVFISSNIAPSDLEGHLSIDKTPANTLKAQRIVSRLQALVLSVNMDDSGKYKR